MHKNIVWLCSAIAILILIGGIPSVSATDHKYNIGDIVYTGAGSTCSEISDRVVIVVGIPNADTNHQNRPAYYQYVWARLFPCPSGWVAPGGYSYSDTVWSMKIKEFEGKYPVSIQRAGYVRANFKIRTPLPDFSQIE